MGIFENMGVVAAGPHPKYGRGVHRAPLVKVFKNHNCMHGINIFLICTFIKASLSDLQSIFLDAGPTLVVFLMVHKICPLDKTVNMMELLSTRSCMHLDSTTSSHVLIEMILLR